MLAKSTWCYKSLLSSTVPHKYRGLLLCMHVHMQLIKTKRICCKEMQRLQKLRPPLHCPCCGTCSAGAACTGAFRHCTTMLGAASTVSASHKPALTYWCCLPPSQRCLCRSHMCRRQPYRDPSCWCTQIARAGARAGPTNSPCLPQGCTHCSAQYRHEQRPVSGLAFVASSIKSQKTLERCSMHGMQSSTVPAALQYTAACVPVAGH